MHTPKRVGRKLGKILLLQNRANKQWAFYVDRRITGLPIFSKCFYLAGRVRDLKFEISGSSVLHLGERTHGLRPASFINALDRGSLDFGNTFSTRKKESDGEFALSMAR